MLLRKSENNTTYIRARHVFRQVLTAARHLLNTGYTHGDIKPENVLTDQHYKVKLCDFGMAQVSRTPLLIATSLF